MVDHVTPITPEVGDQNALIDAFQKVAHELNVLEVDLLIDHDESVRDQYISGVSKAVVKELPATDEQRDIFQNVVSESLFSIKSKFELVNPLDPVAVKQVIDAERKDLPRQLINSAVKEGMLPAGLHKDF